MSATDPRAEDVLPGPRATRSAGPDDGRDITVRWVEGVITIEWHDGRGPVMMAPEVIEAMVRSLNEGRAESDRLKAELRRLAAGERARAEAERLRGLLVEALDGWGPDARSTCTNGDRPPCRGDACDCTHDIRRIRREAGLT